MVNLADKFNESKKQVVEQRIVVQQVYDGYFVDE